MSFQDLTGSSDSGKLSKRGRPLSENPSDDALRMRRYHARIRSQNGGRLKPRKALSFARRCDGIQLACGFRPMPYYGVLSRKEWDEVDAACDRFLEGRGIPWVKMTMGELINAQYAQ